jgi:16S rRNA processing protein RimM
VGLIVKPHGTRGEVLVKPLTNDAGRYRKLQEVRIEPAQAPEAGAKRSAAPGFASASGGRAALAGRSADPAGGERQTARTDGHATSATRTAHAAHAAHAVSESLSPTGAAGVSASASASASAGAPAARSAPTLQGAPAAHGKPAQNAAPGSDAAALRIEGVRFHGSQLFVKFAGHDDANAALALKGRYISVLPEQLVKLAEDEYFVFDLIGCDVYSAGGDLLGRLADVLETGSNDVYAVERAGGGPDLLIPAIKQVVMDVRIGEKKIVVDYGYCCGESERTGLEI